MLYVLKYVAEEITSEALNMLTLNSFSLKINITRVINPAHTKSQAASSIYNARTKCSFH